MQVLTIPDLHGRDSWKNALEQFPHADKIVFLGDYVDSYDLGNHIIYDNLYEIIQFKKGETERVELLLGNHDIQYMFFPKYRCSGFRPSMQYDLFGLFNENKRFFNVAFQVNNNLWTHAGVSENWLEENFHVIVQYGLTDNNYAEVFNVMLNSKDNDVLHQVSNLRGGYDDYGGITWADKQETMAAPLKNMNQYVGHTPLPKPFRYHMKGYDASITYLDCLQTVEEFRVIATGQDET